MHDKVYVLYGGPASTLALVCQIIKILLIPVEGWQPVLLKCVDPSQLPAHWGGDLVGPNGDRECTHLVKSISIS